MSRLKIAPTILVKNILRFFYGLFCLFCKVDKSRVTFASYRSNSLKDNLYFVNNQMEKEYPSYKRYFLFRKMDTSLLGKLTYVFHMIHSCYRLATSRYFIVDDYYFPIYVIKPRLGTEIIQLWHSSGALKKFGWSTVGKPFGSSEAYLKQVNIHGNYSKVYVSSKEVVPYFSEAFNMPSEKIFPLGVPRTDYFFSEENAQQVRERFYNDFPELASKKLVLYAPTFRGKSHYQGEFECPFDITKMEESLSEEYALLIHLHPYMHSSSTSLEHNSFMYNIQHTYTIQELLVLTDILITDYSTVFFDYSLLNRPMIFYPYDLETYIQERDFYYNYEDILPGPIALDTEMLIDAILNSSFDNHDIDNFSRRFFDFRDGNATERIVEHILN